METRFAVKQDCMICGTEVERPGPADIPVYQTDLGVTNISGVATHAVINQGKTRWAAPFEYEEARAYVGTEIPELELIDTPKFRAYHPSGTDYRYGFVSHENCWRMLEETYSPHPVPLEALFDVCRSMSTLDGETLDWLHYYEGVLEDLGNPPSDRAWIRDVERSLRPPDFVKCDPGSPIDIQELTAKGGAQIPPGGTVLDNGESLSSGDIFNSLPLDIRLLVAEALPTADALRLRLASRSFHFILHDQSFWASKFRPQADRAWLSDIQKTRTSDVHVDWRSLYKLTAQEHLLPWTARNRARIWRLSKLIREVTPKQSLSSSGVAGSSDRFTSSPDANIWTKAQAQLTEDLFEKMPQASVNSQLVLWHQVFGIPGNILEIKASFIQLGSGFYIAGITFILQAGEAIHLGYDTGKERSLRLREGLIGFNVETSEYGFHCLQAVYDDGQMSEWLGTTFNMPTTRRLVIYERLEGVAAEFDGCKLVSLSVSRCPAKNQEEADAIKKRDDSMLHSAIWYPDMPSLDIHLNEADVCFTFEDFRDNWYPIHYTHFGGEKGRLLPHLRQIVGSLGGGLEFMYSDGHDRAMWDIAPWYEPDTEFSIDGHGGERIEEVVVRFEEVEDDADAPFLVVKTNRGREAEFTTSTSSAPSGKTASLHKLRIEPGTTITGVYGRANGDWIGFSSETL